MTASAMTGMNADYNTNSLPQLSALIASESCIQCAIEMLEHSSSSHLMIADFGSSHGLNSLQAMKIIFQYLREKRKTDDHSRILVVFNDLPSNDWTLLFQVVSQENQFYSLASGRSFYEQCFPSNSLSIAYSSTSLHWLSCTPCNLSNHCLSLFAESNEERLAFQQQGYRDYSAFLQHRSHELHEGGVIILAHLCVDDQDSCGSDPCMQLVNKCARPFLNQQESLAFNYPVYFRSYSECVDDNLLARYSFKLIKANFTRIESPLYAKYRDEIITLDEFAQGKTRYIRSFTESSLQHALEISGKRSKKEIEHTLNLIWTQYEQETRTRSEEHNDCMFYTYMALKKISNNN